MSDMETGMKAFRSDKLTTLKLTADRFTFEPEITYKNGPARTDEQASEFLPARPVT